VKKGDVIDLSIEALNARGQGVGRHAERTVFVDRSIPEERLQVEVVDVSAGYARARIIAVIQPSPHRTRPFCPVFQECGGCSLQHIAYERQLRLKTEILREKLSTVASLESSHTPVIHSAIGLFPPRRYRNKAQLPFGRRKGRVVCGLYAAASHAIVTTPRCGIQQPVIDTIKDEVVRFVNDEGIEPFDERTGSGLLRYLVVRMAARTGEVMVTLVVNGERIPAKDRLVRRLTTGVPEVKSIYLNINPARTNVVLGPCSELIFGSPVITDRLGALAFELSPHSFYQINPRQTERLYAKTLELARLTGRETVIDLFCGIGTISLFLAERARAVYGIEVVERAVEDARRNAARGGLSHVEFIAGPAASTLPALEERGIAADVIVVDPPRKGCDIPLVNAMSAMSPQRIVYISCNPNSLARDLDILRHRGYALREAWPVDMFPHTAHIETVARLERIASPNERAHRPQPGAESP